MLGITIHERCEGERGTEMNEKAMREKGNLALNQNTIRGKVKRQERAALQRRRAANHV